MSGNAHETVKLKKIYYLVLTDVNIIDFTILSTVQEILKDLIQIKEEKLLKREKSLWSQAGWRTEVAKN